jgi:F-type H+-transporting ATPase subunit delta
MIDVAAEADQVDAIGSALQSFCDALDAHDGLLRAALFNPVFTVEERRAVLHELLPKLGIDGLAKNFLHLVNDKDRLSAIGLIAQAYRAQADERAGRVKVSVTTAEPMSPQIEAEVRTALEASTGKTVTLEAHVDPDLIGGMVARVGGKVYDSSIRTRLLDIRQSLIVSRSPAEA